MSAYGDKIITYWELGAALRRLFIVTGFLVIVLNSFSASTPAYANCLSDPPRGIAAGHRSSVGSGSAKLCSTNWHCAVDESSADRCYVKDANGKSVLDAASKKVRVDWIFDEKLGDYRPRNSGDDVQVGTACRQTTAAAFGSGNRVTFACDSN